MHAPGSMPGRRYCRRSNSVSAANLLYLAAALDKPDYVARAEKCISAATPILDEHPTAVPELAVALSTWLDLKQKTDKAPAKQQAAQASDKAAAEEQRLKVETDKLTADVEQLEAALREEMAVMGMSANEAKIFRLAQRGASEETLATARALTAQHAAVTHNML